MKIFNWNEEKNRQLKNERNISFEAILLQIEKGMIPDVLEHHDRLKYPGQKILVIDFNNYAYLVPMVENETEYFLKSIIPSRKATKKYPERR